MTEKTAQESQTLIAFWDKAFALSEEDQKQMLEVGGSDWKEIAPSEKLYQAACSFQSVTSFYAEYPIMKGM